MQRPTAGVRIICDVFAESVYPLHPCKWAAEECAADVEYYLQSGALASASTDFEEFRICLLNTLDSDYENMDVCPPGADAASQQALSLLEPAKHEHACSAGAPVHCEEKTTQNGYTICARQGSIITDRNLAEVAQLPSADIFLLQCPLQEVLEGTAPAYGALNKFAFLCLSVCLLLHVSLHSGHASPSTSLSSRCPGALAVHLMCSCSQKM
jgi:hypothetical protein